MGVVGTTEGKKRVAHCAPGVRFTAIGVNRNVDPLVPVTLNELSITGPVGEIAFNVGKEAVTDADMPAIPAPAKKVPSWLNDPGPRVYVIPTGTA